MTSSGRRRLDIHKQHRDALASGSDAHRDQVRRRLDKIAEDLMKTYNSKRRKK